MRQLRTHRVLRANVGSRQGLPCELYANGELVPVLIGAGNIHTLRSRRRPDTLHCSLNGTQPPRPSRRYRSSSRPRKSGNDSDDHAIAGQYNMRPAIDMLAQCRNINGCTRGQTGPVPGCGRPCQGPPIAERSESCPRCP